MLLVGCSLHGAQADPLPVCAPLYGVAQWPEMPDARHSVPRPPANGRMV